MMRLSELVVTGEAIVQVKQFYSTRHSPVYIKEQKLVYSWRGIYVACIMATMLGSSVSVVGAVGPANSGTITTS